MTLEDAGQTVSSKHRESVALPLSITTQKTWLLRYIHSADHL